MADITPTPTSAPSAPSAPPAAPVAPTQPVPPQPTQQQQAQTAIGPISISEALYALVCYTYYYASVQAFESINQLDPALVVVNNLANPEIIDVYDSVLAAEEREKALEDRVVPTDTILGSDEEPPVESTVA